MRKALLAMVTIAVSCAMAQKVDVHNVLRIQLKPDKVGEFESAVKELQTVWQKAGYERSVSVWQSGAGPLEFLMVYYTKGYAEAFDTTPPASLRDVSANVALLRARIAACALSIDRRVSEVVAGASLPRGPLPPFVRVLRTEVKVGKTDQYLAMLKEMVTPAMKKAGVPSFVVFRQRYGGSTSELWTAMGVNQLSNLDDSPAAVVKAMGDAGYNQYLARRAELVERSEVNLFRLRKDLTYTPAN
ncbi:MAG: hypothetical protein JNK48_21750 [Bryobacterales bacterium]|nr:hypothetical protein [Bryobacterales bacterium]